MSQRLSFLAVVLAAAGLVVSAASAQAQQPNRNQPGGRFQGGGGFGVGGQASSWLQYLRNEKVQKELEILDEQKADMVKIGEEFQGKIRELFTGGGGNFQNLSEEEREKRRTEMREKGEAMGKELQKKVEGVLLAHQVERLKEIHLQVQGSRAISDPEVEKALGITEEQKTKMTSVRDDFGAKMRELGRDGGREAFDKLRRESTAAQLAVLTAEQAKKFEKMKGEALNPDLLAELQRGGFGFGGGQPGQPGRRPGGDNAGGNNANPQRPQRPPQEDR